MRDSICSSAKNHCLIHIFGGSSHIGVMNIFRERARNAEFAGEIRYVVGFGLRVGFEGKGNGSQ